MRRLVISIHNFLTLPTLNFQCSSSPQLSQNTPLHTYPFQQSPPTQTLEAADPSHSLRLNRPQPLP
jgi:hypothetical protein